MVIPCLSLLPQLFPPLFRRSRILLGLLPFVLYCNVCTFTVVYLQIIHTRFSVHSFAMNVLLSVVVVVKALQDEKMLAR